MSKIIDATGRIPKVPSFEELELEADAREAADNAREGDRYNANKLQDRALAINGALNTFDFVPITGREYWQVYGRPSGREASRRHGRAGCGSGWEGLARRSAF